MYNSIALLIGHMAGDYLLQNDWMAVNKSQSTAKGLVACNLHCLLYSLAVATVVCLGGWVVVGAELFVFGRSINWIVAFLIAYRCPISWIVRGYRWHVLRSVRGKLTTSRYTQDLGSTSGRQ
jgi:hypothetical protein